MDEQKQTGFFYEILDASLPRLGPGDDASTLKAIEIALGGMRVQTGARGPALRILDLGCGNGAQTMVLAKPVDCRILAVDNHAPYLDELHRRAGVAGVSDRIEVLLADMAEIGPNSGPFELVWSEGALYSMGFVEGLEACRRLIAPGGCLGVTELCWFSGDVPEECRAFFEEGYPAMVDIDANLDAIGERGYELLEHFSLPESSWWEQYYHPLEERLTGLREAYADDAGKLEMLELVQYEIDIFRRYSDYYGYEFFIMRP